jgi:glycosyltransferase involved in cell wall biosynthesis
VLEINAPSDESRLYKNEYAHIPWLPERLERFKLRHADGIVTISTALKKHLVAHLGADESRVVVAPNGADTDIFHPEVSPDREALAKLGDGPVVGFVGSFQKWHGSELLARMIADVSAACPDARFLMVGDGPERERMQKACERIVAGRVLFTGRVDHARVPGLVACMSIAVVADTGFYMSPLKVIEWMAAGKAVVAPAYGPLAEIIDDGVEGLLFPPGDIDALVGCVRRLLDDSALGSRLGHAAANRVRRSLTWRHNAERVIAACRAAVERRANRVPHAANIGMRREQGVVGGES